MISFEKFYEILEEGGKFRESLKLKHEGDLPMFSIFTDRTDPNFKASTASIKKNSTILRNAFWSSRRDLQKIGFPAMHANVIFKTINAGHAGLAHGASDHNTEKPENRRDRRKLRHMTINQKYLTNIEPNYQDLVDTITHEWSHLWMFNHGLEFRRAMDQYHEALVNSNIDKVKPDLSKLRFSTFYMGLQRLIANYKKDEDHSKLHAGIEDYFDNVLQGLGAFYKHIPYEFADQVIDAIVHQIEYNVNRPTNQIEKVIKGMDLEKHVAEYLTNDLKLNPAKVGETIKGEIAKKVNFPSAYGLTDSDETFAVAIEKFNELDPYHKKRILELMQTR